MISTSLIKKALPNCKKPEVWSVALSKACTKFDINSKYRLAAFMAQTAHESGQYNTLIENMNYRAARLMKVWPSRFPDLATAMQYEKNPEKLGNFVYAKRIGNGSVSSGDGFRYRGRGLIQLTGKSNYAEAGKALSLDLINKPDLLIEPQIAALSAAWFWSSRGLNALADNTDFDNDQEDFKTITRRIKGSTSSNQARYKLYNQIITLM